MKFNDCPKEEQEIFKKIVACDVCKRLLALSMYQPLRCPSLSYNEKNEQITPSGRLWSEVIKESEDEHNKKRNDYIEKNKEHIITHGLMKI